MQRYGVRLLACGPNRLAVLTRVRPLLAQPPAAVRAAVDSGEPVLLTDDIDKFDAEKMAAEFQQLGATVEIFVSYSACELE